MRVARLLYLPCITCTSHFRRAALRDGPYELRTTNNEQQKSTGIFQCFFTRISGFLSSQGASPQVLSAFAGLTAVFGMGTGGSPQLSPLNYYVIQDSYPDNCIKMFFLTNSLLVSESSFSLCIRFQIHSLLRFGVSDSHMFVRRLSAPSNMALCLSQVLGLLVPVRSVHRCTSTPGLSTTSSLWDLTC